MMPIKVEINESEAAIITKGGDIIIIKCPPNDISLSLIADNLGEEQTLICGPCTIHQRPYAKTKVERRE
jgi:hypothetical protein